MNENYEFNFEHNFDFHKYPNLALGVAENRISIDDLVLIMVDPSQNLYEILPHSNQFFHSEWMTLSLTLFAIGLSGMVFNYKNFLVTMMCAEIMYLGAITGFVLYGLAFHDTIAAIYGLLILIFAACESAVGLGLLVAAYRFGRTVGFNMLTVLGG